MANSELIPMLQMGIYLIVLFMVGMVALYCYFMFKGTKNKVSNYDRNIEQDDFKSNDNDYDENDPIQKL